MCIEWVCDDRSFRYRDKKVAEKLVYLLKSKGTNLKSWYVIRKLETMLWELNITLISIYWVKRWSSAHSFMTIIMIPNYFYYIQNIDPGRRNPKNIVYAQFLISLIDKLLRRLCPLKRKFMNERESVWKSAASFCKKRFIALRFYRNDSRPKLNTDDIIYGWHYLWENHLYLFVQKYHLDCCRYCCKKWNH